MRLSVPTGGLLFRIEGGRHTEEMRKGGCPWERQDNRGLQRIGSGHVLVLAGRGRASPWARAGVWIVRIR